MKISGSDLMWTVGLFLLLTLCFWLMIFLPFSWKVSALIAGAILVLGIAAMIYFTAKSREE